MIKTKMNRETQDIIRMIEREEESCRRERGILLDFYRKLEYIEGMPFDAQCVIGIEQQKHDLELRRYLEMLHWLKDSYRAKPYFPQSSVKAGT